MPPVCQNLNHPPPLTIAQKHARLTFLNAITSNWGSKGLRPWPGVPGARSPLAAACVGHLLLAGKSSWGSTGLRPWPGVPGARSPRATARVGDRLGLLSAARNSLLPSRHPVDLAAQIDHIQFTVRILAERTDAQFAIEQCALLPGTRGIAL
jgi:hypothetical protein